MAPMMWYNMSMADINTPPPTSSGLSDFQLKLSYFYVSNKLLIRKLFIGFLIAAASAIWLFVLISLALWLIGYRQSADGIQSLLYSADPRLAAVESVQPLPLAFSDPEAFGSDGEKFDLLAEASNPNDSWLAEFDYSFKSDNSARAAYHAFVLPGSKKILLDLNQPSSAVKLEISNLKWRRVSGWKEIAAERARFAVSDDKFIPAAKPGEPSRISFALTNDSAFSYWEVGVAVMLYNSGSLAAINYVSVPQFKSESTRQVELNWPKPLSAVDSWQIIPEVNFLDSNNIMPPPSN